MMMQELAAKLRQDQGDQLAKPPRSHIDSTAAWLRQRMADPQAGAVWNNLPNVLGAFSESAVVEYIGGAAPDLVDSEAKKGWLVSLVELLKKRG